MLRWHPRKPFNILFSLYFSGIPSGIVNATILHSLLISICFVLIIKDFWSRLFTQDCFFSSFFRGGHSFCTMETKSLSLLIFVERTGVSYSRCICSTHSVFYLLNLLVIMLLLFGFDVIIDISEFPIRVIPLNKWVWHICLNGWSAIASAHDVFLNSSDTAYKVTSHWCFFFHFFSHIHNADWDEWSGNYITKRFLHNMDVSFIKFLMILIFDFNMSFLLIILWNGVLHFINYL
jgi:hypothetical protein